MSPVPEDPAGPEPEAAEAIDQLRKGLRRARVIVREARQAIGQAPPDGPVLPPDPEPDAAAPIRPAD